MVRAEEVFKSINIYKGDKVIRLDVGMNVIFTKQSGEIKKGLLVDIKGKEEKAKLFIQPHGEPQIEEWAVMVMDDDSLDIDEDEEA